MGNSPAVQWSGLGRSSYCQGPRFDRSLVGELISHKPSGQEKKKKKSKDGQVRMGADYWGGNTIFETHHFMALKLFNEWLTANVKQIAIKLIYLKKKSE